ncbi:aminopeptidase N-like [Temnothorax curvispinosus]|uniref:Aminopeptidase N-like n=1 Tax=Temnothorax curvispinosus TaxID=300111 RepID=A0A6J1PYI0_9HYME|nr:aminopeptidase N-like [Temnothorax curvispinosus]
MNHVAMFREDILCVLRNDSVARIMEVVHLIGYNIAYQLFSTIVNPSWWSHLWINQGLSLLIGMEAIDEIVVQLKIMDLFIVQNQYESFKLNSYFAEARNQVDSPSEINSLLYLPHHFKASCLLLMLQHLLSRDVFWKGVQIYLDKHEFNSATSDNLWDAMQIALSETDMKYKPDLKKLMNDWTQQKNYPVIIATLHANGWVKVSVYFNETDDSWIPLTYTTQSVSNFDNTSINGTLWLECKFQRFDTNPEVDNWIIVNLQQSGYYRVNYNDKNWLGIAAYLKTPNYMKMHVLNRAKIIDDAFYFMVAGKLNSSVFWDLTSYLSQETDFIAWYPMFKVFEHMSTILPFSNERVEKIKMKMYPMLDGVLKNTGYDEKSKNDEEDFTKRLMQEAAKWACIIRHPDCIGAAQDKHYEYLNDPKKNSPLPWWKEWTFCYGLFDIERYTLTNSRTPTSLLGCSGDNKADFVIKHLQLIASKQDDEYTIVTSFHSIVARQSRNDEVLDYMLSNFDELKPRKNDMVAALIDIINHVYSKEQLMKIRDFAKKHVTHQLLSIHLISNVLQKISLRQSQIDDQMEYIQIWESLSDHQ